MMGTIRNIIINAALGALVVAFILFWVFASMGMRKQEKQEEKVVECMG